VLAIARDGLDIGCAEGALRLTVVQREGGRAMSVADYLNARLSLRS
jgi:methionyl-tRNA formyltransferase